MWSHRRIRQQNRLWSPIPSGNHYYPSGTAPLKIYTIEELKWDILILRWRGIGNDLK
jgi:hypothetical protein